jgi:NADH-quinone oxidoreductase subunit G
LPAEPAQVTLTIDGREVTVPAGTLVIRAAERLGIYIPRFCDHPYLAPLGACRQCLVEIEGQRKPLTACTTPVIQGMVVRTQATSAMAREAQEGVLELLLVNHPLDCPMCDKGGECPLQDQALAYGPGGSRFVDAKRRFAKPVPISPLIYLDRERCVLCARCTRFAQEISGDPFIELFERGALEQVAIFEDEPYRSVFSGNVVQICPVGALTSGPFRFRARPFDLVSASGVCNLCAAGCNQVIQTRRDRIVRVLAAENPEVNEAWNCDRGRFGHAYVQHPDRVVEPLVRKEGELVAVSWAEALRVVVERIGAVRRAGARAAVVAGGRLADEDAYALSRFARTVLGTNDVDVRLRPASAEEDEVLARVVRTRGTTYADLERARAILVVGADLVQEAPIAFLRVRKAATRRGAVVAELSGRASGLAQVGRWVPCPPGGEGGVLAAVATELLARGVGRPDPSLRQALEEGAAADLWGVAAPDVGRLADMLAGAGDEGVILAGERLARSPGALAAAWNLALLTGARFAWLPRRGGMRGALWAGLHPRLLPGGRRVEDPVERAEVEGIWGAPVPTAPGRPAHAILEEVTRETDLGLLLLVGADPASDFADASLGARAVADAPFLVALDLFLTASSGRAEVVLPACALPEREATLTDWEGRAQPSAAAVAPPGVARPDWEILSLLAGEAGVAFPKTLAELRREMRALARELEERTPVPPSSARVPRPDDRHPFVLLTYPLLVDAGVTLRGADDLLAAAEEPAVELAAEDARRLGVAAGDRVRVTSLAGSVEAPARPSDGLAPSCVFVPANQPGLRGLDLVDAAEPVTLVRVERA